MVLDLCCGGVVTGGFTSDLTAYVLLWPARRTAGARHGPSVDVRSEDRRFGILAIRTCVATGHTYALVYMHSKEIAYWHGHGWCRKALQRLHDYMLQRSSGDATCSQSTNGYTVTVLCCSIVSPSRTSFSTSFARCYLLSFFAQTLLAARDRTTSLITHAWQRRPKARREGARTGCVRCSHLYASFLSLPRLRFTLLPFNRLYTSRAALVLHAGLDLPRRPGQGLWPSLFHLRPVLRGRVGQRGAGGRREAHHRCRLGLRGRVVEWQDARARQGACTHNTAAPTAAGRM